MSRPLGPTEYSAGLVGVAALGVAIANRIKDSRTFALNQCWNQYEKTTAGQELPNPKTLHNSIRWVHPAEVLNYSKPSEKILEDGVSDRQ
jgi:hypothetical protein